MGVLAQTPPPPLGAVLDPMAAPIQKCIWQQGGLCQNRTPLGSRSRPYGDPHDTFRFYRSLGLSAYFLGPSDHVEKSFFYYIYAGEKDRLKVHPGVFA